METGETPVLRFTVRARELEAVVAGRGGLGVVQDGNPLRAQRWRRRARSTRTCGTVSFYFFL